MAAGTTDRRYRRRARPGGRADEKASEQVTDARRDSPEADRSHLAAPAVPDGREECRMINPPFTHRVRVRYSETDQQGIVFSAHYLEYYSLAVTEMFRAIGWTRPAITGLGVDAVIAESTLRFRRSIGYDDLVDIRLPITRLGTTCVIIEPQFVVDGSVRADGSVRHVFLSAEFRGKAPIPEGLRGALEPLYPASHDTNGSGPVVSESTEGAR